MENNTRTELKHFDGKCVRIIDSFGEVLEGFCCYNNEEYNEHEYGWYEDGVKIVYFLFYRSEIKEIFQIDPESSNLAAWGRLEELAAEDGLDGIEEMLFSEEPFHVRRMIRYLNSIFDSTGKCTDNDKKLVKMLEDLTASDIDDDIKREAAKLASHIEKI